MKIKTLLTILFAFLFLGGSKAHEGNALNTIIRADKKELVQAGDFSDAFFNIVTKMTGDTLYWTDNTLNRVPILVRYPEGAGNEAGVVASALYGIRERLLLLEHGKHCYDNTV